MKSKKITRDRLNSSDCYRAQVQIPDKRTWAFGYNAIFDFDPNLARDLRDELGAQVEARLVKRLRNLLIAPEQFRDFYANWLETNVDTGAVPLLNGWLFKHDVKKG